MTDFFPYFESSRNLGVLRRPLQMKRELTQDELIEHWTPAPGEFVLLMNKSGAGRLGFAVLLKCFQREGRFPANRDDVPNAAIEYLVRQTRVTYTSWDDYGWQGRTIKYHRAEIRSLLGFRKTSADDSDAVMVWIRDHVLTRERKPERIREAALERLRELQIEPPTKERWTGCSA